MNTRRFLVAAVLVSAPAPLLARPSDVLVVAPTGGNFTAIQPAINAAVDGDIILVKNGTYPTFAVVNESLSVVADAGHLPLVQGAIRVRNVDAGKHVLIAGLSAQGDYSTMDAITHGVNVVDCAGDVHLQDCFFRAVDSYTRSGAEIVGSARVSFARCEITGSNSTGSSLAAGTGLHASSSQVVLYDTLVSGGLGWSAQCFVSCWGTNGGSGGIVSGGALYALNATFRGGSGGFSIGAYGGCGWCICNYGDGTMGGDGLSVSASAVHSLASLFVGAFGGSEGCGCGPCGFCCGWPPIHGQAAIGFIPNDLPGASRRMTAPHVVRELTQWGVSFHGAPGDRVSLYLDAEPAFTYSANLSGVILTAMRGEPAFAHRANPSVVILTSMRTTSRVINLGVCDASGNLTARIVFPDLGAGVLGRRWFAQPLFHKTNGTFAVGTPNDVVVLDSSL